MEVPTLGDMLTTWGKGIITSHYYILLSRLILGMMAVIHMTYLKVLSKFMHVLFNMYDEFGCQTQMNFNLCMNHPILVYPLPMILHTLLPSVKKVQVQKTTTDGEMILRHECAEQL